MGRITKDILIILILSGIVTISFLTFENIKLTQSEAKTNTEICYNLSFKETVTCLNKFVRSIYNFTVRPDTEKTLEDIKNNGGDCYDYAKLYRKLAIERGFNAETIGIYSNKSGHRFAVIYNSDLSYCVLDQMSIIGCFN